MRIEHVYESKAVKAYKEQQEKIQEMALIGHEADCEDIFACLGCFKREPDKIVGQSVIKTRKQEPFEVIE